MPAKFRELWQGLLARHPWRWALYLVPFTYEFHKCSFDDFREAWIELLVMTFFSTMPLWIMAILGPVIFQTDISFTDQLLSTISGGELFVYCAALIGPLIYIITRRYGDALPQKCLFRCSRSRGGFLLRKNLRIAFLRR